MTFVWPSYLLFFAPADLTTPALAEFLGISPSEQADLDPKSLEAWLMTDPLDALKSSQVSTVKLEEIVGVTDAIDALGSSQVKLEEFAIVVLDPFSDHM